MPRWKKSAKRKYEKTLRAYKHLWAARSGPTWKARDLEKAWHELGIYAMDQERSKAEVLSEMIIAMSKELEKK